MKALNLHLGYTASTLLFANDEQARAAFLALKAAMEDFKLYSNDKDRVATIQGADGEVVVRLDALVAVTEENTESIALQMEWAEYVGRVRGAQKRAEGVIP